MWSQSIATAILAVLAVGSASCTLDRLVGYDAQGVRLVERQTDFIFEMEAPKAKAMGCTENELCPNVRTLLEEKMKSLQYCGKGYSVRSVGWSKGLFVVNGPCQRT